MTTIRIVDVTDEATFGQIPPCADPGFDHRSCDYWEDADRGSKAARLSWLEASPSSAATERPSLADNPFAPPRDAPVVNPFAPTARSTRSRSLNTGMSTDSVALLASSGVRLGFTLHSPRRSAKVCGTA